MRSETPFDTTVEVRAAEYRRRLQETGNPFGVKITPHTYPAPLQKSSTIGVDFEVWRMEVDKLFNRALREWHIQKSGVAPEYVNRRIHEQEFADFKEVQRR